MSSLVRPGGLGRGLVAALVALTCAAGGAAAGSWLGWRLAGALPGVTEAEAVAFVADPQLRVIDYERANHLFAYDAADDTPVRWLLGGDGYRAGYTQLNLETNDSYRSAFDRVRRGLEEHGWQVEADGGELRAVRDGIALALTPVGEPEPTADLALVLLRNDPLPATVLFVLGALAGLLIGWSAGVRMVAVRAGAVPATIGALLALPATALTLVSQAGHWVAPLSASPDPGWWPYMTVGVRPLALLGAVLLIAAGVTAGFRRTGAG